MRMQGLVRCAAPRVLVNEFITQTLDITRPWDGPARPSRRPQAWGHHAHACAPWCGANEHSLALADLPKLFKIIHTQQQRLTGTRRGGRRPTGGHGAACYTGTEKLKYSDS
jgi:hypothetical protein